MTVIQNLRNFLNSIDQNLIIADINDNGGWWTYPPSTAYILEYTNVSRKLDSSWFGPHPEHPIHNEII